MKMWIHCLKILKISQQSLKPSTRPFEGFPGGLVVKNPPANAGDSFNPWVRKILWRRKWQPTPVFLPGKSHGQRTLGGYSPWGFKRVRHNLATER